MTLANLKIRLVVRGRDLEDSRAKLNVDVLVGHDRQVRLILHRQGPDRVFTDEICVARVLRVYRDATVAGDGHVSGSSTTCTLK